MDPLESVVLSVGKFVGGTKANIVAKYTELDISMRYFEPQVREIVHAAIRRHAKAIADMYELQVEVNIEPSAVALRNDEVVTQIASEAAEKVFGPQRNIETSGKGTNGLRGHAILLPTRARRICVAWLPKRSQGQHLLSTSRKIQPRRRLLQIWYRPPRPIRSGLLE